MTIRYNKVVAYGFIVPGAINRTLDDIAIHDRSLFVRDDTRWKYVPVRRWLCDPADWKAMES